MTRVCNLPGPHLVGILDDHLLDGHFDKRCGNAMSAVVFACSQHGDVAAHRSSSVRLELADDDAYEIVLIVQSLNEISKSTGLKATPRWIERTMKHRWPHW